MTDTDQRLRRARAATLASLSAAVLTSLGMPGIGVLLESRTALAILGTVGILAVATTQAAALYAAVTPWTSETTRHRLSIAFAAAAVLSVPLVGPVGADRWDTWAWLGASIAGTAPMLVRPSRAAAIAVATLLVSIGVSWWVDGSPVRSAVIVVGIGLAVAGMCWLPVWLWSLLVDAQAGRTAEARLVATEERLRFARDVHDLLGHRLSVIAMKAELAGRLAATDAGAAAREAGEVRRLAASALDEMRAAVHGYRTVDLREQIAAIEQVLRSSGVRCDATRSPPATSSETATVLAAVLREATAAAQSAAIGFVQVQPDTVDIGVVAFGQGALTTHLPTKNHDEAIAAINRLTVAGGTSLGQAILGSLTVIVGQPVSLPDPSSNTPPANLGYWASATIVLLSDGEDTGGPDAVAAAELAADAGVHIETIGVGTVEGSTIEVDGYQVATALNEELLTEVAETTAGSYHRADDAQALGAVYRSLDLRITTQDDLVELTGAAVGIAVLLLTIGGLLMINWFGRIL